MQEGSASTGRSPGWSLAGQTAMVTGVGAGVGRAIAGTLARSGAHVVCADRDGTAAQSVRDLIVASGGSADSVVVDVTLKTDLDRAIGALVDERGRLDVMCNMDTIPGDGNLIVDLDEETFDEVFAGNFLGVLHGCQAAGQVMVEAGRGSIINLVSATLDRSVAGTCAYAVSTASTAVLTKVMARELGDSHVRVNSIAATGIADSPGTFDRPASSAGTDSPVIGRAGTADDVAQLALYLASDSGSFMTGQTLRLSGGSTMQW